MRSHPFFCRCSAEMCRTDTFRLQYAVYNVVYIDDASVEPPGGGSSLNGMLPHSDGMVPWFLANFCGSVIDIPKPRARFASFVVYAGSSQLTQSYRVTRGGS